MGCDNCISTCPWSGAVPIVKFQAFEENGMIGITPERLGKASGIDVFVPKGFESIQLVPGENYVIPLNIRVELPENFDITVNNKSGVATRLGLVKGAELVDEDYRGNIGIHLFNLGLYPVDIKEGMKIAQLVIRPVFRCQVEMVDEIKTDTPRGEKGFGSSGAFWYDKVPDTTEVV
jgi:dUTP pyrophosphatase